MLNVFYFFPLLQTCIFIRKSNNALFCLFSSPYIDLTDCRARTVSADETTTGSSFFASKKKSFSVDGDNLALSKHLFKSDNCVLGTQSCDRDYVNDLPACGSAVICETAKDLQLNCSSAVDLKEDSAALANLTVQSEENIFGVSRHYSLSENSLNASKCSSSRDIYSSHESDSTDFVKLRDNVSQFECSSKSESDVSSTHRVSLPEDELLKVRLLDNDCVTLNITRSSSTFLDVSEEFCIVNLRSNAA